MKPLQRTDRRADLPRRARVMTAGRDRWLRWAAGLALASALACVTPTVPPPPTQIARESASRNRSWLEASRAARLALQENRLENAEVELEQARAAVAHLSTADARRQSVYALEIQLALAQLRAGSTSNLNRLAGPLLSAPERSRPEGAGAVLPLISVVARRAEAAGDRAGAIALLEEAVAQEVGVRDRVERAELRRQLARMLRAEGRLGAARVAARAAVDELVESGQSGVRPLASARLDLAALLTESGNPAAAQALIERTVADVERAPGQRITLSDALHQLASTRLRTGEAEAGLADVERAISILDRLPPDPARAAAFWDTRARLEANLGLDDRAASSWEKARAALREVSPEEREELRGIQEGFELWDAQRAPSR